MMRGVSAHLDTLYATLPPMQRYPAAAADGFRCVEIWSPPPATQTAAVITTLARHELALATVNTQPGPHPDDFGLLGDPAQVTRWREDFLRTLDFARAARSAAINLLIGGRRRTAPRAAQLQCVLDNVGWALARLTSEDPVLLIEPLNGADRRSPLFSAVTDVVAIIDALGAPPGVRILFEAYHVFQEAEDLSDALDQAGGLIGHVQIADYPGRGEPGSGDVPLAAFLDQLGLSGYAGWVGLEYLPTGRDHVDFGWLHEYGLSHDAAAAGAS
jgi:hydroxypyruvate isomerase